MAGNELLGSIASFQVFDANHAKTQTVTEGSFNTINSITGIGINAALTPPDIKTASELTSILAELSTGESYVRAPNLTTAVYALEITDKTSAQITDEVSRFINATKS